jgi:hypothetical protein
MRESRGGISIDEIRRLEWQELVNWWAQARELVEADRG